VPNQFVDDGPPADVNPDELRLPFLVDDHFVPNGCFGDNDCRDGVVHIDTGGCGELPATAQGVCRVFACAPLAQGEPGYQGYLGVLFQDVGPNGESGIGKVPGVRVQAGAKRVVFWAKADAPVDVTFRSGGANNWEGESDDQLPYKDAFGVPAPVTLSTTFEQYTIDLSEVTYEDVVSPFGWAIEPHGDTTPVKLFIADVRWE